MTKLGVSLPLRRRHGHIVAYINAFPTQVAKLSCWKELAHECFWDKPSPEVVVHPEAVISQSSTDFDIHAAYASHQASSRMVVGLEDHPPSGPLPGVQLLRQMARLVRLCVRPRSWLTLAEEQELKEMRRKDLTRPKVSQKHCTHPEFQRYGNAHGRYSRCKRCDLKFKWLPEHEAWVEYSPKSSSSSALPLPSAANILEKGPLAMKAASPKRVFKGKGKSRAG